MERTPSAGGASPGWLNLLFFGVLLPLALLLLVGCGSANTSGNNTSGSLYEGTELAGSAPNFRLVSHRDEHVALSDFRGKVVVMAFLDPACTDVCPLTANQFRLTSEALGREASRVVFLAVNVNSELNSVADVAGATAKWGVQNLENWFFLTDARENLEPIYQAYNILVDGPPKPDKPNELEHTPGTYIIDQAGQKRWYISTNFEDAPPLNELLIKHVKELLNE